MQNNKIELIFEAVNKTGAEFEKLKKSFDSLSTKAKTSATQQQAEEKKLNDVIKRGTLSRTDYEKYKLKERFDAYRASARKIYTSEAALKQKLLNLDKAYTGEVVRLNKAQTKSHHQARGSMLQMMRQMAAMTATFATFSAISKTMSTAFNAQEKYKKDLASISALTLNFMDASKYENNPAKMWRVASKYAKEMVPAVQEIAAKTLLTGEQANTMVTEFLKAGQIIDTNNEKQITALKTIANSLPIATGVSGAMLDVQIVTELANLLNGNISARDKLGKQLLAMNPNIKEEIKLWKAEGTVIENLGKQLKGFEAASKDLEQTWGSAAGAMNTAFSVMLRTGIQPLYDDIIRLTRNVAETVSKNTEQLSLTFKQLLVPVRGFFASFSASIPKTKTEMASLLETIKNVQTALSLFYEGLKLAVGVLIIKKLASLAKGFLTVASSTKTATTAFSAFSARLLTAVSPAGAIYLAGQGIIALMSQLVLLSLKSKEAFAQPVINRGNMLADAMNFYKKFGNVKSISDTEIKKAQHYSAELGKQIKLARQKAIVLSRGGAKEQAQAEAELNFARAALKLQEKLSSFKPSLKKNSTVPNLIKPLPAEEKARAKKSAEAELEINKELQTKLNSITLDSFAFKRWQAKEADAETRKMIESEVQGEKKKNALIALSAKVLSEELKSIDKEEAKQKRDNRLKAYAQIGEITNNTKILKLKQLNELATAFKKEGIDEVAIKRWKYDQLKAFELAQAQHTLATTDNVKLGVLAKFSEMEIKAPKSIKLMTNAIEESFRSLSQTLGDVFFNAFQGRLKNLGDYVRAFTDGVKRSIANAMGQVASNAIRAGIGSFAGSLFSSGGSSYGFGNVARPEFFSGIQTAHNGGRIVPQFHAGGMVLRPGDVPAILQEGEFVIQQQAAQKLGGGMLNALNNGNLPGGSAQMPNVTINVINQSSQQLNARQSAPRYDFKQMVIDVVLEDVQKGGALRSVIAGGA